MARAQRHTWAQEVVSLLVTYGKYGSESERRQEIDFAALRVARGGLLEEATRDAAVPVRLEYASAISTALPKLCKSPDIRRILSTTASSLSIRDIHILFSACEDIVAKSNYTDKAQRSLHTRRLLMYCRTRLASGETVDSCGFPSRFRWYPKSGSVNLLSETYDDFFDEEFLRQPLTALPLCEDLETTASLATKHLTIRLQRILDACEKIMDDHEECARELKRIQKEGPLSGLPQSLTKQAKQPALKRLNFMENESPEVRLKIALHLSKKYQYHKTVPPHTLHLYNIPILQKLCAQNTARSLLSVLLAEFYSSAPVLIACFVALLAETGWNPHTLLSLSATNVDYNNGVYTLVGLKTKSDQLEEATISAVPDESSGTLIGYPVENPLAIRAIALLLAHRKNVEKFSSATSDSLFVALNLKYNRGTRQVFTIKACYKNLAVFCKHAGIPRFAFSDIRDQAAHIKFLAQHRDLFAVQAYLNHASPEVTESYLNSTIIRCLGEANIRHFVKLLATSTIFVCGRASKLTPEEAKMVEKNNLLFPVSSLEDTEEKCISDAWFHAMGDFRFAITETEIEHTALQYLFYKKSLRPLVEPNHLRFVYIHLPRILFCVSLHQLILQSKYRRLLEAALARFEAAT